MNKSTEKISRHPTTTWAQRSDKVFITIELPDAKNVKLTLQPEGHFYFSAVGPDGKPYEVDLELYDKVNVEESKAAVGLRHICYLVKKAEKKWWSRLVKQGGKPPLFLKVDWDKWIDEDDEKDNKFGDVDYGNMDFSKLDMGGDDAFDMDAEKIEDDDEMEEAQTQDAEKDEGNVEIEEGNTSAPKDLDANQVKV